MHMHKSFNIGIQLINCMRRVNTTPTGWHLTQQYRDIWITLNTYICYRFLILFKYFMHRLMFTIISTRHQDSISRRFVWVDNRVDPTAKKRDDGTSVYIAWGRDTKYVQPASNVRDQSTTNHDRIALIGLWSCRVGRLWWPAQDKRDDRDTLPNKLAGLCCRIWFGWSTRALGSSRNYVIMIGLTCGTSRWYRGRTMDLRMSWWFLGSYGWICSMMGNIRGLYVVVLAMFRLRNLTITTSTNGLEGVVFIVKSS